MRDHRFDEILKNHKEKTATADERRPEYELTMALREEVMAIACAD
jgi:hypothetical protein